MGKARILTKGDCPVTHLKQLSDGWQPIAEGERRILKVAVQYQCVLTAPVGVSKKNGNATGYT